MYHVSCNKTFLLQMLTFFFETFFIRKSFFIHHMVVIWMALLNKFCYDIRFNCVQTNFDKSIWFGKYIKGRRKKFHISIATAEDLKIVRKKKERKKNVLWTFSILFMKYVPYTYILGKPQKKVIFLVAGPLRGGGG